MLLIEYFEWISYEFGLIRCCIRLCRISTLNTWNACFRFIYCCCGRAIIFFLYFFQWNKKKFCVEIWLHADAPKHRMRSYDCERVRKNDRYIDSFINVWWFSVHCYVGYYSTDRFIDLRCVWRAVYGCVDGSWIGFSCHLLFFVLIFE